MNKELLDQVKKALQAQQDTIKRQKWIIDQREQENEQKARRIAQLTQSLHQLATSQTQELKALPTLFSSLKDSMSKTTTEYQNWSEAQKMRQDSQIKLTSELIKVANKQIELTKVLSSYQKDIPSLTQLQSDTTILDEKLSLLMESQSQIESSQTQIDSSSDLLMKSQKETESQVARLNQLLSNLKS